MFDPGLKVIADIGQNHNGDPDKALNLIYRAKHAGCTGVKFTKRDPNCFPESWKKKPYDNPNSFGETYYEHRCALELSESDTADLINYARKWGLLVGASFVDTPSLDFLCSQRIDFLKIASSRCVDLDLLGEVNRKGKPVILSTGMSNLDDVIQAIDTLLDVPYIALMQCTASYPTKTHELNLGVLRTFVDQFKLPVGLSSHCLWYYSAIVAVAYGAEWFEWHLTSDRTQKGTDHACSLLPYEFTSIISMLALAQECIGDTVKKCLPCEEVYQTKLRDDLNV